MDKYAVWVKASERLPEKDGRYVYKNTYSGHANINIAYFNVQLKNFVFNGHELKFMDRIEWLDESQSVEVDRGVEKAAEEAIDILTELCNLKHYKDEVGKDSMYERMQPELWKRANNFLNSIAGAKWAGNDAVEFAEWKEKNQWWADWEEGRWLWSNDSANPQYLTTEQLYNLFKQKQL